MDPSESHLSTDVAAASTATSRMPRASLSLSELNTRIAAGDRLLVQCVTSRNERHDTEFTEILGRLPLEGLNLSIVLFDTRDTKDQDAIRGWNVETFPAFVLFSGGVRRATHMGLAEPGVLEDKIRASFNS